MVFKQRDFIVKGLTVARSNVHHYREKNVDYE